MTKENDIKNSSDCNGFWGGILGGYRYPIFSKNRISPDNLGWTKYQKTPNLFWGGILGGAIDIRFFSKNRISPDNLGWTKYQKTPNKSSPKSRSLRQEDFPKPLCYIGFGKSYLIPFTPIFEIGEGIY